MSLSRASLPPNFQLKLARKRKELVKTVEALDTLTDRVEEYTAMWQSISPLMDYLYESASADNGRYAISLKIPDLPSDLESVAARQRYMLICLYVHCAVSHCKSLLLDQYERTDLESVAKSLDDLTETLVESNVESLNVHQHVANIMRIFSDEDVEIEGEQGEVVHQEQSVVVSSSSAIL